VNAANGGKTSQNECGVAVAAKLRSEVVQPELSSETFGVLFTVLERFQEGMLTVDQCGASLCQENKVVRIRHDFLAHHPTTRLRASTAHSSALGCRTTSAKCHHQTPTFAQTPRPSTAPQPEQPTSEAATRRSRRRWRGNDFASAE
jgi:hypothetical protein